MKTTLQTIHNDLLRIEKLLKPEIFNQEMNQEWFVIDDGKKKTSELLDDCKKLFPVWSYYSDKQLDEDFPPVKTVYKYKKVVEADENLKNKSADDLDRDGIKGITLRERIIMELQYFKETGKHLDIKNITLCAGSRDSDSYVPSVDWDSDGRLRVVWVVPGDAVPDLRSRQRLDIA